MEGSAASQKNNDLPENGTGTFGIRSDFKNLSYLGGSEVKPGIRHLISPLLGFLPSNVSYKRLDDKIVDLSFI